MFEATLRVVARSVLSHAHLHREGSSANGVTVAARDSIDFLVDGASLLDALVGSAGGHRDFMGPFVKGYPVPSARAAKTLLEGGKDSASGRVVLYQCPECGGIGCGAYAAFVEKGEGTYTWRSFAYENDYEEPRIVEGLGPYTFEAGAYVAAIEAARRIGE